MKFQPVYLTLLLFGPSLAHCADDVLPKAEDVLDRFVAVTGGTKAYAKIQNRRERIEFRPSFQKGVDHCVIENELPDNYRGRMQYPDGTVLRWGHHAGTVWKISAKGPSIRRGQEEKWVKFYARVDLECDWRKLYSKVSVSARRQFGGVACYEVKAETKSGLSVTQYFEVETGLRRGVVDERESPGGTRRGTRVYSDYRKVDGVMIPHKMSSENRIVETGEGWTTTAKLLSVEHNVDFPKDYFEPPAEIKALQNEKQGSVGD